MPRPSLLDPYSRRLRRKFRWLTGRGWTEADFAARYAEPDSDSWGYRRSPRHQERVDFILAALPKARFGRALEAGCAQGFLTEPLAARVDRLIACDISEAAVRQARQNCRELSNVEFYVADIRKGLLGDGFDLCVFSDVLYYLSPREIDGVLAEAGKRTREGGYLLVVNEWAKSARDLTPPSYAFGRLDANPAWRRAQFSQTPWGDAELSLAVYQRN
jgi:SAM-dependent methyltransferase